MSHYDNNDNECHPTLLATLAAIIACEWAYIIAQVWT